VGIDGELRVTLAADNSTVDSSSSVTEAAAGSNAAFNGIPVPAGSDVESLES
jgi:hypothetical protein